MCSLDAQYAFSLRSVVMPAEPHRPCALSPQANTVPFILRATVCFQAQRTSATSSPPDVAVGATAAGLVAGAVVGNATIVGNGTTFDDAAAGVADAGIDENGAADDLAASSPPMPHCLNRLSPQVKSCTPADRTLAVAAECVHPALTVRQRTAGMASTRHGVMTTMSVASGPSVPEEDGEEDEAVVVKTVPSLRASFTSVAPTPSSSTRWRRRPSWWKVFSPHDHKWPATANQRAGEVEGQ